MLMPAALPAQTTYTEGFVNLPGFLPQAYGIDSNDQIVGFFYDNQNVSHGFVLSQGVIAQIDVPGAVNTTAYGIDSVAGIAGYYAPVFDAFAGMLDSKRAFKNPKGSSGKVITGINATGTYVGYTEASGKGFINAGGVYTDVVPAVCAALPRPVAVFINGVNSNGDYVGYCQGGRGKTAGFTHVGGVDQSLDVFGRPTFPTGINDTGTIVGFFSDTSGFDHGFIYSAGTATQYDFGGRTMTAILGINSQGSLTGITWDNSSPQWTGFYAFAN
jgi:probable HAF family extracellular repeat protein